MSEPIIVGTDGSESADRAVQWAAEEAVRRGRPLHILCAEEPWAYSIPLYYGADGTGSLTDLNRGILTAAEKLARDRRPELRITSEMVAEPTVHALCERSARAFEIVVGHRGLGGFGSMVLGSVGLRTAQHASAPVVIVRGEARPLQGEVAVGIEVGEESTALEHAFEAAAARGARLRVVHAWQIPDRLLQAGARIDERQLEEAIRWQLIEAHAPFRKRFPGVEVVEEAPQDHPVAALEHISREVDLVVVGAHERKPVPSLQLGSVSHGVVHHAHCPVVVARKASS
ncbi:universal stress protein [Spirillospora sp. NPDC047279]|uniref:universal stress protein n=1 Tax=Spirillospora sp. NPDC047279 TaxID=3155478 RepID=UPI0033CAF2D2